MQHRPIHPFGWIIRQEREHEQAIVDALRARGAAPAADRSAAAPVAVPDTVDDARKRGVSLEKQTVAAYDAALAAIDDSALRGLLTRLRDESKMHLAAFESGQPVGRALGGMGIQGRGREPGRGQGGLGPRRGGGRTRATVPAAAPDVSAGPASCRMVVGLAPGGPCWTFAR
jgi:hypothetical protein